MACDANRPTPDRGALWLADGRTGSKEKGHDMDQMTRTIETTTARQSIRCPASITTSTCKNDHFRLACACVRGDG